MQSACTHAHNLPLSHPVHADASGAETCTTVSVTVQPPPALTDAADALEALAAIGGAITAAAASSSVDGLATAARQLAAVVAATRAASLADVDVEEEQTIQMASALGALQALLADGGASAPDTLAAAGAAEALVAAAPGLAPELADDAMAVSEPTPCAHTPVPA